MEKIDVVVVGAGLAGLSCAYKLAEKGLQVIVVERGDFPGSKNVTGGRLYTLPIKPFIGDMLDEAPFERQVVRERLSLLAKENSITVDFTGDRLRREGHSYTVLRARFDRWLSEKLTSKGVFVISRHKVDDLIWEEGLVSGIRAGSEEIRAHVVVASDGVLSFMAEKAGLKSRLAPERYALAMKEIIELPEGKINDRFNVETGQGVAHLFAGDVTKGIFGGGFLYTNRDTVSIGVVAGIEGLMERTPPIDAYTLIDAFKERYEIRRLLDGGNLVEYSAHIIPEGGYKSLSKLYGNGIIVTGDAAGFALNMGVTVRGMDFAIVSGILAAETIFQAKDRGDFSAASLASYEKRLRETFVLQDFEASREMTEYLEHEDFFSFYPERFPGFLEKIMWFGEGPKERLGRSLWNELKSSGMLSFKRIKDLYHIRKI
ncbi:MAG TPA: FAD-dependent oxidoreductase [Syntrophorhabdaceae bacterium]|nr:FAD-dependent oxidoreductase [Syntrophorhabdaceae bacterium]